MIIGLYKIGEEAEYVYFLVKGQLARSVGLELKAQNKYPVGNNEWEVVTTTRRLLRKAELILPGSILGQEFNENRKRIQTIEAVTNCRLLFISQSTYIDLFSEEERQGLEGEVSVIAAMQIENAERMSSHEYLRSYKVTYSYSIIV